MDQNVKKKKVTIFSPLSNFGVTQKLFVTDKFLQKRT